MALDTTALVGTAVAVLEADIKAFEAKIVGAWPTVDLSLLQAFVTDLAAQTSPDASTTAKLKADVKAGIGKLGHLFSAVARDVADTVDPTISVTTTAAAVATVAAPVKVEETAPPSEPKA